jgi:ferric-dicitrate binding protein FerR (iron transport regulator)
MSEPFDGMRMEEATHWFAVLRRGVMTLEERARHEQWQLDPANRAAFRELEALWDALGVAPLPERALARGTCGGLGRPALVAAMCALSLVIGVLSYSGQSSFWTALDWTDR